MLKSTIVLTAAVVLLSACGPARNPGYVCMHDCAHYCQDGIKGDQCRRDIQLQSEEYNSSYPDNRIHSGYYYGDTYYYGNGYPATTTQETVTYPNSGETVTTTTYRGY